MRLNAGVHDLGEHARSGAEIEIARHQCRLFEPLVEVLEDR